MRIAISVVILFLSSCKTTVFDGDTSTQPAPPGTTPEFTPNSNNKQRDFTIISCEVVTLRRRDLRKWEPT